MKERSDQEVNYLYGSKLKLTGKRKYTIHVHTMCHNNMNILVQIFNQSDTFAENENFSCIIVKLCKKNSYIFFLVLFGHQKTPLTQRALWPYFSIVNLSLNSKDFEEVKKNIALFLISLIP